MILSAEYQLKFWSKVDIKGDDECWEWQGARFHKDDPKRNYGAFRSNLKTPLAHRVAWSLRNGRLPKDNLQILHSCDNPPCCNPNHLHEGTNVDNVQDAIRKGRRIRSNFSLNDDQVKEIRNSKDSLSVLAERFNTNTSTVSRIKNNIYYK